MIVLIYRFWGPGPSQSACPLVFSLNIKDAAIMVATTTRQILFLSRMKTLIEITLRLRLRKCRSPRTSFAAQMPRPEEPKDPRPVEEVLPSRRRMSSPRLATLIKPSRRQRVCRHAFRRNRLVHLMRY